MVNRRGPSTSLRAGFTLLELIVSMSILTIFLGIVFSLTLEMYGWQKRLPIDFHKHPQIIAVVSRMRRDVLDARGTEPYYEEFKGYERSPKMLILETVTESGAQDVVWDFSTPGLVVRRSYNFVGDMREWKANGVPVDFTIEWEEISGRADAIHVTAVDKEGRVAIQQVFFPRTHG